MRKTFMLLAGLSLAVSLSGQLIAQSTATVTLITAGRLLDPRTGTFLSPAALLIQGDRIARVGARAQVQAEAPADAKVLDLGNATLLPGLIDGHTHLFLDIIVPPEEEMSRHSNRWAS
jgi:imidazolonepropionase-like amidohydrolase